MSIQGQQTYDRLRNAVMDNPAIEKVAGAENHIGPFNSYYRTVVIDTSSYKTRVYEVGARYFEVLGLELVSGRDFIEDKQTDYESAAIIDENFVKQHGLTNPIDARITYQEKIFRVIGVVKNHLSGLKATQDQDHFFVMAKPQQYQVMVVRTKKGTIRETQQFIEAQWKKVSPGKPFESRLQDDSIYEEANGYNRNLKKIFLFLTMLGCLLSVSGIYSLASLNVQKRTKEIGIRKVLGASITRIVRLVNQEFAIILAIAILMGGMAGYFLTGALMNELYRQHITVGLIPVILCGLFTFVIGISATSGTILRAALTNPTESLKNE